jgi:hypothetical protein
MDKVDDGDGWTSRAGLNLFSPENINAVTHALAKPGGLLVGWHRFYRGGNGPSLETFTSLQQYLGHIERSRPGDNVIAYELETIMQFCFLKVGRPESSGRCYLEESSMEMIRAQLRQSDNEGVMIIRRFVGPLTGEVEAKASTLYDVDSVDADFRREVTFGHGELLAIRMSPFDWGDAPFGDRTPSYAIVDAKRPNDEGLVPLRGPY